MRAVSPGATVGSHPSGPHASTETNSRRRCPAFKPAARKTGRWAPCSRRHEQETSQRPKSATSGLKRRIGTACRSAEFEALEDRCFLTLRGWVMVLVTAALTSTAFGAGVIMGRSCTEGSAKALEERGHGMRVMFDVT
jgi:hypothetical protein